MRTCHTCGKELIRVDGSPSDSDDDSVMINDYIMQTDWYKRRKPDWFKVTHPNPYVCRRCVKLLVDNGFAEAVGGDAEEFLTTQSCWEGFLKVAADRDITDEEVEKLFYAWILNSKNNKEIRILVNILDIDRPKLAEKIALKFLSLMN